MAYRHGFVACITFCGLSLAACAEESALDRYTGSAAAADAGGDAGRTGADAGMPSDMDGSVDDEGASDFARFDLALTEAIERYNETAAPERRVRGASAVVVDRERGVVHTQGYGEYDADRLYLIASASKILSVGVLMRLADQGLIDIDRPISDYLGEPWGEHKTDVTVAQLVSNSSGLPSLEEIANAPLDPRFLAHLCQYSPAGTLEACGRSIYEDELPENNREPDVAFRYGGSQWQLAGAVAEQVTGKKWSELIEETYVEPCDVDSLGYTNQFGRTDGSDPLSYPATFMGDVSTLPATENPSIEGGAYITGPDYGKLLHMHLRGGTCGEESVLTEDAVARMQENRIGEVYGGTTGQEALPGYGLGWWIQEDGSVIADPGAYGAYPIIDRERGYAAMILLEVSSEVGGLLMAQSKPALDAIFDARSR